MLYVYLFYVLPDWHWNVFPPGISITIYTVLYCVEYARVPYRQSHSVIVKSQDIVLDNDHLFMLVFFIIVTS